MAADASLTADEWLDKLEAIGIGYRKNFGEGVDSAFPHSHYTFQLRIDSDGISAQMVDADDDVLTLRYVRTKLTLKDDFKAIAEAMVSYFSPSGT